MRGSQFFKDLRVKGREIQNLFYRGNNFWGFWGHTLLVSNEVYYPNFAFKKLCFDDAVIFIRLGSFFFEIGSKAQKRKGFVFWKIFIFCSCITHSFILFTIIIKIKKTFYISDYVLRGIWGFLIFFCWKKLFTFSPCIFHTMYKTNFFILIHSLGTFSLCGVVCLSKKEGILRKCKLQKSGELFFFRN